MRWSCVIASVVLFAFLVGVASAQGTVAISRWNISAGGGRVSGGVIAILGSLGQAMAGPSSAGTVVISAGFLGGGGGIAAASDSTNAIYLPLVVKSAP